MSGAAGTGRPALLAILGPTGTGKSALAVRVAQRIGAEVVGCDALQVYRGFDVGTAKPAPAERGGVPHHLIDAIDPHADCTVAEFVRLAERAISEIAGRGRTPVLAGGTGLYLRGLLRGIVDAPGRDPALRARLDAVAVRRGTAFLHRWLAARDPASAARLSPADGQRIVRALELALGGEATWSERLRSDGTWTSGRERHACLKIGLDLERQRLRERLDARVERFFAAGLVDEVRRLLAQGIPPTANAFKAIGYREVLRALHEGRDPDAVREEVKRNTRRYAKRQRTWFRAEPGVVWLDVGLGPDVVADRTLALWDAFLPRRGSVSDERT